MLQKGLKTVSPTSWGRSLRKSIKAYQDFANAGGLLYVPTSDENAQFKKSVESVCSWFKGNIQDGDKWFNLLSASAADAEKEIAAEYVKDLK